MILWFYKQKDTTAFTEETKRGRAREKKRNNGLTASRTVLSAEHAESRRRRTQRLGSRQSTDCTTQKQGWRRRVAHCLQ